MENNCNLTDSEKELLSSMLDYLIISGFCDFSIDYEELTEEELEKQSAEKILKIKEKILGKDYSSND
jgi:hypothetical protein